ncbi:MAG: hypothetical protein ABIO99_02410 [Candidatus Limnocylindria bacterium]
MLGATACSSAASATPGAAAGDAAAGGDIPDNAVFLTYADTTLGFSIQYVEGWQVSPDGSGVVIRDKDSSETVAVVTTAADAATYVAQTDLPALQQQAGFALVSQDTVTVGAATYPHLVYTIPSPPDPVTDKRVPSTIDRYYVQANGSMAVVSLSTPDGVDNVDAFRQMIESFTWS